MNILRLGKVGIFLITIISFNSCRSIVITEATKKLHVAGRPNLNNYYKYSFVVKSKESFTLLNISLEANGVKQKIEKYSFINLENATGHTVLKTTKKYKKGNYKFTFRTNLHQNSNEYLVVEYTIKNKKGIKKMNVINLKMINDK